MFLTLALTTLATCTMPTVQADGETITAADKYVFEKDIDLNNGEFSRRLSLIAPLNKTEFAFLDGLNEPGVIGLYNTELKKTVEGSYNKYLLKNEFYRLSISEEINGENQAELLDYRTKKAVGLIRYSNKAYFPTRPSAVLDLCTGAYEEACELGYDAISKTFNITTY